MSNLFGAREGDRYTVVGVPCVRTQEYVHNTVALPHVVF